MLSLTTCGSVRDGDTSKQLKLRIWTYRAYAVCTNNQIHCCICTILKVDLHAPIEDVLNGCNSLVQMDDSFRYG